MDLTCQLALDEFPHAAESASFVRKRAHGSKLESASRKQREQIINKATYTLSLLPSGKAVPRLLSKRDVASMSAAQNTKSFQRKMY